MAEPENKLTASERAQIRAIKKRMEHVDYDSFSGEAIRKLFDIIERLTGTRL